MSYSNDPIVRHYERCFDQHGDNHKGVDWPDEKSADLRHRIMIEVTRFGKPAVAQTFLDYGCGYGRMYELNKELMLVKEQYSGYDVSEKFIEHCRKKYPEARWYDKYSHIQQHTYVVMNGVFTMKCSFTFEQAWQRMRTELTKAWELCTVGVAFNVMSAAVDWQREDLFHLPTDTLIEFVTENLSRRFVIRQDYGLREYTMYVYK
jgi:SAM-dependent methyltransferase